MGTNRPYCPDSRPCFARIFKEGSDIGKCTVLQSVNGKFYKEDGECPFCKPKREVTNGKFYPYDPLYGER